MRPPIAKVAERLRIARVAVARPVGGAKVGGSHGLELPLKRLVRV
eukprot:CAMPEP_0182591264 /NCGR_PEP_ID=MMETSP1324-20130603/73393_1 /TAXON_ID=236786 /ORGANISM="Florenciella sp., Strain RCC1587" /LENGTH=44 /DNA_ID= /DNA_START= /DNA_END= /DNA_ORIENTATION=